ncbi:MAG: hypothetical protein N7Q72_06135, partial [Spiroplasma sp. Tabriz.8]|nr:hypothetical protein [Spiroplasma sp. Tabriz.8]
NHVYDFMRNLTHFKKKYIYIVDGKIHYLGMVWIYIYIYIYIFFDIKVPLHLQDWRYIMNNSFYFILFYN